MAGSGDYVVEAVGADSFAERLAAEAREHRAPLSPLQLDDQPHPADHRGGHGAARGRCS